jgi:hypothetical protein
MAAHEDRQQATDRTAVIAVRIARLAGQLERTRPGRRQAAAAAALSQQLGRTGRTRPGRIGGSRR